MKKTCLADIYPTYVSDISPGIYVRYISFFDFQLWPGCNIPKRDNRFLVAFSASFPFTNTMYMPQYMLLFSDYTILGFASVIEIVMG